MRQRILLFSPVGAGVYSLVIQTADDVPARSGLQPLVPGGPGSAEGLRDDTTMTRYSRSIDIGAPPERVWAVMSDVERWPDWTPSMTSVTLLEPGPLARGSRARVVQPKLTPAVFTVTEVSDTPQRRSFTWRMSTTGIVGVAHHVVEPSGAGARATLAVEFSGPLGWLVARLYRGLTVRYLTMEAEGLKRRCES